MKERVWISISTVTLILLSSVLPGCIISNSEDTEKLDFSHLLDFLRENDDLKGFEIGNEESFGINVTSWQMENGGWGKGNPEIYKAPWDNNSPLSSYYNYTSGAYLGTFDNNATTWQIRLLAGLYLDSENENNRSIFLESVSKGMDFILESQYPSGGWPQVYPERIGNGVNYSNLVTFNDDTMPRVILLIWDMIENREEFESNITDNLDMVRLELALNKGIDYVLKSQIKDGGELTIWCQQHDPETYSPMPGRPYELVSKVGRESAGVVAILLNWPDRNEEIINSTWGAVNWYEENMIWGEKYDIEEGIFIESPGSMMWYRFYNVSGDQYFMAGRDGVKVYDIEDLDMERRTGYWWAGDWGTGIINAVSEVDIEDRK